MKHINTRSISCACATLSLALAVPAFAQEVVKETKETRSDGSETTTTTTTGTISEFGGERLIVRTESATAPITYRFNKTTTYVDEAGAPVSVELVKSGLPVTVHYIKEGDAMIARKVIVKKKMAPGKTVRSETKTTTTMGTVSEFSPERIIVRTESSPDPLTYTFNKTTTYVDEAGAPVSIETVKSGLPVTIHYITEGDNRIASKVVVRKKTTTVEKR